MTDQTMTAIEMRRWLYAAGVVKAQLWISVGSFPNSGPVTAIREIAVNPLSPGDIRVEFQCSNIKVWHAFQPGYNLTIRKPLTT